MPEDPDYVYPQRKDSPGRVTPHVVSEVILAEPVENLVRQAESGCFASTLCAIPQR